MALTIIGIIVLIIPSIAQTELKIESQYPRKFQVELLSIHGKIESEKNEHYKFFTKYGLDTTFVFTAILILKLDKNGEILEVDFANHSPNNEFNMILEKRIKKTSGTWIVKGTKENDKTANLIIPCMQIISPPYLAQEKKVKILHEEFKNYVNNLDIYTIDNCEEDNCINYGLLTSIYRGEYNEGIR